MESYLASLPRKRVELRSAWDRWCKAPEDVSARLAFLGPVRRLAGVATGHGFDEISAIAMRIDLALASPEADGGGNRAELPEFREQVSGDVEKLLAAIERALHAPVTFERRARPPRGARAAEFSVLLVEDDEDQASDWRDWLTNLGVDVRVRATIDAFDPTLPLDPPDVLLIDYYLGNRTAAELVREIDRNPVLAAIPRVCFTLDTSSNPRRPSQDAGFAAMVLKTVSAADLVGILRDVIAASRRARDAHR